MRISSHKTSSTFRRYNITNTRDIREALKREQECLDNLPRETNVGPFRKASGEESKQ
jgi:hypothetical protein